MNEIANPNTSGLWCWENPAALVSLSWKTLEQIFTCFWSSGKRRKERGMRLEKHHGADRGCWAGNQTEPSPLARHGPQTRVTQPGCSLVVWCAEWDLIKMQVSPLWNTVRHSQEDWKPTVFSPQPNNTSNNFIQTFWLAWLWSTLQTLF